MATILEVSELVHLMKTKKWRYETRKVNKDILLQKHAVNLEIEKGGSISL